MVQQKWCYATSKPGSENPMQLLSSILYVCVCILYVHMYVIIKDR